MGLEGVRPPRQTTRCVKRTIAQFLFLTEAMRQDDRMRSQCTLLGGTKDRGKEEDGGGEGEGRGRWRWDLRSNTILLVLLLLQGPTYRQAGQTEIGVNIGKKIRVSLLGTVGLNGVTIKSGRNYTVGTTHAEWYGRKKMSLYVTA
ncbi:hypothetical protein FB451DRAFT_1363644 [Mycena latifolia]|nr:hypothetical protein FB451DRAFT_1363644 [Mycena latifolia]